MADLDSIMDMLDWNMPIDVQRKGVNSAKEINTIVPFIQPLTPRHNKNVWENCAIIISEESDNDLKPHLVKLLEWLQDMNWPGAIRIFARLREYSDDRSLVQAIIISMEKARLSGDKVWEKNLNKLQSNK